MKNGILLICLLAGLTLFAQKPGNDVVVTKNGQRHYGKIIDKTTGVSVKIETNKKHVEVIPWDDVLSIGTVSGDEEITRKQYKTNHLFRDVRKNGFAGEVIFTGYSKVGGRNYYSLSTSAGYQFNPYFLIMTGFGGEVGAGNHNVPIFTELRVNLMQRVYSPFFFVSPGYAFQYRSVGKYYAQDMRWDGDEPEKVKGGFYLNTGVGLKYMFKQHFGLALKGSLRVQHTAYSVVGYDYYTENRAIYVANPAWLFGGNVAIAMQF